MYISYYYYEGDKKCQVGVFIMLKYLAIKDVGVQKCQNFGSSRVKQVLYSVTDPDPFDTDPDPAFHFDTDPDPAFKFDTDPDPALQFDTDPDPAV